jgi:hypothetical protein
VIRSLLGLQTHSATIWLQSSCSQCKSPHQSKSLFQSASLNSSLPSLHLSQRLSSSTRSTFQISPIISLPVIFKSNQTSEIPVSESQLSRILSTCLAPRNVDFGTPATSEVSRFLPSQVSISTSKLQSYRTRNLFPNPKTRISHIRANLRNFDFCHKQQLPSPFKPPLIEIKSEIFPSQSLLLVLKPVTSTVPWKIFCVSDVCGRRAQKQNPHVGLTDPAQIGSAIDSHVGFSETAQSGSLTALFLRTITVLETTSRRLQSFSQSPAPGTNGEDPK